MTREREDELVLQLQEIEDQKLDAIRAIVEASLAGQDSRAAQGDLLALSRSKIDLTSPSLSHAGL